MNNTPWNSLEEQFLYYASLVRKQEEIMEAYQFIAASKNVLDAIKTLNSYAEGVQDIQKRGELMRVIGQINMDLADTQIKLAEIKLKLEERDQKIASLEKEVQILRNPEVEVIGNFYHRKDNKDGPFCIACYDKKQGLNRVTKLAETFAALAKFQCPSCKSVYS